MIILDQLGWSCRGWICIKNIISWKKANSEQCALEHQCSSVSVDVLNRKADEHGESLFWSDFGENLGTVIDWYWTSVWWLVYHPCSSWNYYVHAFLLSTKSSFLVCFSCCSLIFRLWFSCLDVVDKMALILVELGLFLCFTKCLCLHNNTKIITLRQTVIPVGLKLQIILNDPGCSSCMCFNLPRWWPAATIYKQAIKL